VTVKSVLEIAVDDSQFKRFSELFDRYQEQLSKTPNVWKKAGGAQAAMATQFERMTAGMMAQAHAARETSEDDKKRLNNLSLSEKLWTSMAKSTGSFAKNVVRAGESLLKWTGLLSAVSGILGAGGLFGIDRMAARASGERRSATGLGMSIGQEKAFGINFSRFVNPDAFLSGVNEAQSNVALQGNLRALGVNPKQSVEKVALATLDAIRAKAKGMPEDQLGLLENMFHVSNFGVGVEDLKRMRAASPDEWATQRGHYAKDVAALNIDDKSAKGWMDFTAQMQRAEGMLHKVFVVGLAPLAKPLEHLSASFVKFVATLLKSPMIERGINSLAKWLDNFSGEISAPKFLDAVKSLVSDTGAIAEGLHVLVTAMKIWAGPGTDIVGAIGAVQSRKDFLDAPTKDKYLQFLAENDKQWNLPAGTSARQWMQESGGGRFVAADGGPLVSSKGAIGPFQFMLKTAKELGIDPMDARQSAYGAGMYDAQLRAKYGGDMDKALAAYNMGPGALDKLLAQHKGKDWLSYAPKETRDYVANTGVKVVIVNQTGGSAIAAASALAPPAGIALP
jgi:hypothetical protein